jgi:tetratricopeptide (TPR) repeat protein
MTLLGFAVFISAIILLPENPTLNKLFGVFNTSLAFALYQAQKPLFEAHLKRGGQTASAWPAVGLCFAFIVVVIGIVLGVIFVDVSMDEARFDQATAHIEAQRYAEAEQILAEYSAEYPEEKAAYWNLAIVCENTGRLEEGLAHLNSYLRLEPMSDDGLEFKQRLHSQIALKHGFQLVEDGQLEQALQVFVDYNKQHDDNPAVFEALGHIYSELGRDDEAKAAEQKHRQLLELIERTAASAAAQEREPGGD